MKTAILLAIVLVLTGADVDAFRGVCGMAPDMDAHDHWSWGLDLTEDQRARIQAGQAVFMREINPLRDRLFSRKMELRELSTSRSSLP